MVDIIRVSPSGPELRYPITDSGKFLGISPTGSVGPVVGGATGPTGPIGPAGGQPPLRPLSFFPFGSNYASLVERGTDIANLHAQAVWQPVRATDATVVDSLNGVWTPIFDEEAPGSSFLDWTNPATVNDSTVTDLMVDQLWRIISLAWLPELPTTFLLHQMLLDQPTSVEYIRPYFWVSCTATKRLVAYDSTSDVEVMSTLLTGTPSKINVGDDGLLYVISGVQSLIDVVNPATGLIVRRFLSLVGGDAIDCAVRTGVLYVTSDVSTNLVQFDSVTGAPIRSVDLGESGGHIAVDDSTQLMYIATHTGFTTESTVVIYDMVTNAVVGTIPNAGRTIYNLLVYNGKLYSANYGDFTYAVTVIDCATRTIDTKIATGGIGTYGLAIAPNGYLYTSNADTSNVIVIDTATNLVVGMFPCGTYEVAIAYGDGDVVVCCDGRYPVHANYAGGCVIVMNAAQRMQETVQWTSNRYWGQVAVVPTTSAGVKALAGVELGRFPSNIVVSPNAEDVVFAYPQRDGVALFSTAAVARASVAVTNANAVTETYEVVDLGVATGTRVEHVITYLNDYTDIAGCLALICPETSPITFQSGTNSNVVAMAGTTKAPIGVTVGNGVDFPQWVADGVNGRPYLLAGQTAANVILFPLNAFVALTQGEALFIGQADSDPPVGGTGDNTIWQMGGVSNGPGILYWPGINVLQDGFGSSALRNTGYATAGAAASAPFMYDASSGTSWQSWFNGNSTHAAYAGNVASFAKAFGASILQYADNAAQYFKGKFYCFAMYDHVLSVDERRAVGILSKIRYSVPMVGI